MFNKEKVLYKGNTGLGSYQVVDMVYEGRKARVLFSGDRDAAFSGMPLDGKHELLFDYIQRLFELVSYARPRRLLIIGGGTFTLPSALMNSLPGIQIDVVEIDPGLGTLAKQFFNYQPRSNMQIYYSEGKDFLKKTKNRYDMILVDAFTNLEIPDELEKSDTAKLVRKKLTPKGIFAINVISSFYGRAGLQLQNIRYPYDKLFEKVSVYPADSSFSLWSSQNFIVVAQKGEARKELGMRFEEVTEL